MYEIITEELIMKTSLRYLHDTQLKNSIVVAERKNIQDILVCNNSEFSWHSLYLRTFERSKYVTACDAVQSRFDEGYRVYVFQNRDEFRNFLKYNGERQ